MRRREEGLQEIRLLLPDPRSEAVKQRMAQLSATGEQAALDWIEAASEFDEAPG